MSQPTHQTFSLKADKLEEVELKNRYVQCVPGIGKARDGDLAGERVMHAPNPLPCTVILVHGVNSEGEWYNAAEDYLCQGLNDRLGRHKTPAQLVPVVEARVKTGPYTYGLNHPMGRSRPDFDSAKEVSTDPLAISQSPVLRFYWGYKAAKGDYQKPSHSDVNDRPGTDARHRRQFPVSLDEDDCWGGGPFQNGTPSLWSMYRKEKGFTLDYQRVNPISDRFLTEAPPRTYYVHAARRLAHLVATLRKNSPQETINIVSHSQGTMIAMLAVLMLKEKNVRGPEALFVCNSPFSLNKPGGVLETGQLGNSYVINQEARFKTLKAVADAVKASGAAAQATTDAELDDYRLCTPAQKPYVTREQYGQLYVYANPHDRVMGASLLRSIGWRGLMPSEQAKLGADNVMLRVFSENIEVGKGSYSYTMSANAFGITKDDRGNETGRVRSDFWYPASEKVMSVYGVYSPPLSEECTVVINAKSVAWVLDDQLKSRLGQHWPALVGWSGRLKKFDGGTEMLEPLQKGADARDVAAYKQVYGPNYAVVRTAVDIYGNSYPIYKTINEAADELIARRHNMTDHSSVPSNEFIVRGVMAWDLALGLNQSYTDLHYWRYLKTLADWKLSDPYFLENDGGALPEPGKPPPGLDITPAYTQAEAERAMAYAAKNADMAQAYA